MAKRVFQIAKELGVESKAVVKKCHAEGVPDDVIKNHMSTVSAGLEATIREWFATEGAEASGTAVETAEKVDIKKVRAKPRARTRAKSKAEGASTEDGGGVATATTEAPKAPTLRPTKPAAPAATPAPAPGPEPGPEPQQDDNGAAVAKPSAPAAGPPAKPEESEQAPETPKPAEQNVPKRPEVVAPAGPKLEVKTPVKLSGPKVVRVEAPERLEPPRPRRSAPAARGPAPGGRGVPMGPPDAPGDGRAPRRGGPGGSNRRRTPNKGEGEGGGGGGGRRRSGSGHWSEQDLAEREARLQRAGGFMKKQRQQARRQQQSGDQGAATPAAVGGRVQIQAPFTIKDISAATGVKGADIVKKLFMTKGLMATINSGIEPEQAQEILMDWDIELEVTAATSADEVVAKQFSDREIVDERPRGPVITILGHVDHGKTSLLDKIRNANVAEGEAGGITQATSAFRVPVTVGEETRDIVFLDTPGHEAFTAMRARGANMTDLVVLVVAADDGVMPQTKESISHCKAAGVPMVVALNKIDKPEATDSNIQKILGELAEQELNPVEWGGDTEVVRVSAVKGEGIDDLLETLEYQSQLLELKADFGGKARGVVVEAQQMEGRGVVANILVQQGELNVGDFIVAGRGFGRVRDISDDRGKKVKSVLPPSPVQISGLDELPDAGDHFYCVDSIKQAQEAAEERRARDREAQLAQPKVTLDTMFSKMADAELKEILVVVKADVQGSVDVLKNEIEKISGDEVKVRVLHAAVGGVTESDVLLAEASNAVIIGFNVIASNKARRLADDKGVEFRPYQVIYDITDDIKKAAEGLLEPELRQEVLGHAEVRRVFKISKVGAVAGCYVTDGVVQRDAYIRVTRDDIVIEDNRLLEQLKRVKDDVKEVRANMECGMKIVGYDDIKEGDILECYKRIEVKRTL